MGLGLSYLGSVLVSLKKFSVILGVFLSNHLAGFSLFYVNWDGFMQVAAFLATNRVDVQRCVCLISMSHERRLRVGGFMEKISSFEHSIGDERLVAV